MKFARSVMNGLASKKNFNNKRNIKDEKQIS